MGGSAGKIVSPVVRGLGDVATFGTNELLGNPLGNASNKLLGGGGGPGTGSIYGNFFGGHSGGSNPYISGPFSLDPNQLAADQNNINTLGQQQYDATNNFITGDIASRQAARDQLAKSLITQSQDSFKQALPGTEETLNAQHLLNGSGLGQELARQQGNIATNIADRVGTLGAQDIDLQSQQKAAALQGLQGFQTGALQRGQSLEDFINQANVAKTIGAQMAPQPPSGKQNFGTVASGIGALSPYAKLGKGAAGIATGNPALAASALLPSNNASAGWGA